MAFGKKKNNKMPLAKRQQLAFSRNNKVLSSASEETVKDLGLESYGDYLYKVYLPTRVAQLYPSLSQPRIGSLMKYLILGTEIWELIVSNKLQDLPKEQWPGRASFRDAKALDKTIAFYRDILDFEEGRIQFLNSMSTLVQEYLVPPAPGSSDNRAEDPLFAKLDQTFGDEKSTVLIMTQALVNNRSQQTLLSPVHGVLAVGDLVKADQDRETRPWPLYTNIEMVDVIMVLLSSKIHTQLNGLGSSSSAIVPNHKIVSLGDYKNMQMEPPITLVLLFYHPIIPSELKSLFPQVNLVFPETEEELENMKKEYGVSDKATSTLDAMYLAINNLITESIAKDPDIDPGRVETKEIAEATMLLMLGLNNPDKDSPFGYKELEGLAELGLSDEEIAEALTKLLYENDYSVFDSVKEGLGPWVKQVIEGGLDAPKILQQVIQEEPAIGLLGEDE